MSSRAAKILQLAMQSIQLLQNDDAELCDSSPAPSLPDELQFLLQSDDSVRDPNFEPNDEQNSPFSDENEVSQPKKRRKDVEINQPNQTFSATMDINPCCSKYVPVSEDKQNSVQLSNSSPPDAVDSPPLTKRGTLRVRGLKDDTRQNRLNRKIARNIGKKYVTCTGKVREAKQMKPLSTCKMRCKDKFLNETLQELFDAYWSMGDFNKRLDYISGLIEIYDKKRETKTAVGAHFRQVSVYYYLHICGEKKRICKTCFLKVFCETTRFLETVINKKRSNKFGIAEHDNRGNHEPSNKTVVDELVAVRDFLNSVPSYESHYSRKKSSKRYLPSFVTITKLYEQYKEKHSNPVSRRLFEKEFHKMNLCIKKPHVDTCALCDKLTLQMTLCEEKELARQALLKHQAEAQCAYDAKSEDKSLSKSDSSIKTITFDMQQCLPTPYLQNSVSFYKRQLWTFNLTVHDCVDNQGYCFVWHEGMGGRGANDIGSCLYQYLMFHVSPDVKHIIMYSDTCTGQNKNTYIAAMCFLVLQNSQNLETIDHKFLIPGHTHMECDADHSLIEKKKKKYNGPIEHPHDWAQLMRMSAKTNPFVVTEMKQENFLDFASIFKGPLQLRKTSNGNTLNWRNVKWLHYKKEELGILYFKNSLSDSEFSKVSFLRKGNLQHITPRLSYNGQLPITQEKKKDLLELLPFINPVFHNFYRNLKTSKSVREVYPDTVEDSDEE